MSYLTEGLECYVAGLFKAAAVMVGAAAESVILDLRDATVQKLTSLGMPVPKGMEDWRIKTVSDALRSFFEGYSATFTRELREPFGHIGLPSLSKFAQRGTMPVTRRASIQ